MTVRENINAAISGHNALAVALSRIAHGRTDNGRPLGGETARRLARDALIALGMDWGHILKVHEEMEPVMAKAQAALSSHQVQEPK